MARYRLATVTGFTNPAKVSLELNEEPITYVDPADDKQKLAGGATKKMASGTVTSETEGSAFFDSEDSSVAIVFQDCAGSSDLTITLPKARWNSVKGETGVDDTNPAKFEVGFVGEVPA